MAGWPPPPPLSTFLPFSYASVAARRPSLPPHPMDPAAALAILDSRPSLPDSRPSLLDSAAAGAVLSARGRDAGAGGPVDLGAGFGGVEAARAGPGGLEVAARTLAAWRPRVPPCTPQQLAPAALRTSILFLLWPILPSPLLELLWAPLPAP
jgi:hypothetical protein